MKTFKVYALGCKVNQYDSQLLRERFGAAGYRLLDNDGGIADLCVINTCTVTAKADRDSLNVIRRAIKENPWAKVIVAGCLAQLDKDRLRQTPGITEIVDDRDAMELPRLEGISFFAGRARAFLKVQDGCDNFCSYCKVPLVRGTLAQPAPGTSRA